MSPETRTTHTAAPAMVWLCRILLMLLVLVAPAIAQQASTAALVPDLLGSPQALGSWLVEHSHDAAAAAARVAQAQAQFGSAKLHPNLLLNSGLGGVPVGPTNPPGTGFGGSVNYGVGISQLFEIGKRRPRITAAGLRLTSQQDAFTDNLVTTFAQAREAMARVLYLKSRQAALQESLDFARQIVGLQRVRYDRGDLSGTDFDRLQLDTQVLEADLAQNQSEYVSSLATCTEVLTAPCDPGAGGLDTLVGLTVRPGASVPVDWERQIAERPDLRALASLEQATAQDGILAHKRRVPDPVVSVAFTRDQFVVSGNNPRTLAVGVTIPLATSDRGQHDEARAIAQGHELNETSAAILQRAKVDVIALRDRQTAIASTLDTLRTDALPRADGILQSTSTAVAQGELSTTDLLLARRARTDIALKTMDLEFQLFLAQNELRQVLGLDATMLKSLQEATWPTR